MADEEKKEDRDAKDANTGKPDAPEQEAERKPDVEPEEPAAESRPAPSPGPVPPAREKPPAGVIHPDEKRSAIGALIAAIVVVAILMLLAYVSRGLREGAAEIPAAGTFSADPGVYLLNADYDRTSSPLLVRKVVVPTLARLDFAAYDSNVLLFDPKDYQPKPPDKNVSLENLHFHGTLASETLCDRLEQTPLTAEEKAYPMAWEPMKEHLINWNFELAMGLEEASAAISDVKWNDPDVIPPYQNISRAYLHKVGATYQMWVRVEFKPWVTFLEGVDDEDGDKFPEIYARLESDSLSKELVDHLVHEYMGGVLGREEVNDWAYELGTYWYPSYFTETLKGEKKLAWPDRQARNDLGTRLDTVPSGQPTLIIVGKPFGQYIYLLYFVEGFADEG